MVENRKKYVINVDFSTISRIHLNPLFFDDMWCRLNEEKMKKDGGKVYVTAEQARKYLNGEKTLFFNGRPVANLAKCMNCSKRCRQSSYWDI